MINLQNISNDKARLSIALIVATFILWFASIGLNERTLAYFAIIFIGFFVPIITFRAFKNWQTLTGFYCLVTSLICLTSFYITDTEHQLKEAQDRFELYKNIQLYEPEIRPDDDLREERIKYLRLESAARALELKAALIRAQEPQEWIGRPGILRILVLATASVFILLCSLFLINKS